MVDATELAKQPAHLGTAVAGEVRADPGLDVGCLPHIENSAGRIDEPVDAGSMGEPGGEAEFGGLRMPDQPGEVEQFLESEYPERSGSFEQRVQ